MKNERRFCKCSHCGNIISYVHCAGPGVVCCGEEMQEMKPNTADASKEKHVPEVSRDGNKITVTVGSVPHPMTDEHHIAWIVAAEGDRTQRVVLPHTGAPSAGFITGSGLVTVYAYCNLHGLWMAEA